MFVSSFNFKDFDVQIAFPSLNAAMWIHTSSDVGPWLLKQAHCLFLSFQLGYCYLVLAWAIMIHCLLSLEDDFYSI